MTKQPGVPGQNNPEPLALFGGHFLVRVGKSDLMDPSYGRAWKARTDFELDALDYVGLMVKLKKGSFVLLRKPTGSVLQFRPPS